MARQQGVRARRVAPRSGLCIEASLLGREQRLVDSAGLSARHGAYPLWQDVNLPDWVGTVSSTQARTTDPALMAPEAARFDAETGAWTDPARYETWLARQRGN